MHFTKILALVFALQIQTLTAGPDPLRAFKRQVQHLGKSSELVNRLEENYLSVILTHRAWAKPIVIVGPTAETIPHVMPSYSTATKFPYAELDLAEPIFKTVRDLARFLKDNQRTVHIALKISDTGLNADAEKFLKEITTKGELKFRGDTYSLEGASLIIFTPVNPPAWLSKKPITPDCADAIKWPSGV